MFESLKAVNQDQMVMLIAIGGVLAVVILHRLGFVILPGQAQRRPDPWRLGPRPGPEGPRPVPPGPSMPDPVRLSEFPTTQALTDSHRASQAALEKRQAQLEAELEMVKQTRGVKPS
jgi:hypothetical protein